MQKAEEVSVLEIRLQACLRRTKAVNSASYAQERPSSVSERSAYNFRSNALDMFGPQASRPDNSCKRGAQRG